MSIRAYVPTTMRRLRAMVTAGGIGPAPFVAHAVTDGVRAGLPDGGDEEWEYAAASAAAQSSVGMLDGDEPPRRVVLAVDVPAVRAGDHEDPSLVEVDEVVPMRQVAAVLADSGDAGTTVDAARDALAQRSADAERLLARCLDHQLGWWGAQEIGVLLESDANR